MELWKVRAAARDKVKSLVLRTHPIWSKVMPGFYYPYKFSGGRIYLNIKESQMMLARALGRYEIAKHKALQAFLSRGGIFIDVGVNKSDFSLLASRLVGPEGRVMSFEPAPDNCHWIRRSIEKNGYTNIDLYEIALSDENGDAQLYLGKKSGWHSLISGQPDRDRGAIQVKTRRLDDFLDEIGFKRPINVMKVDVEGADMHVLRGAHNALLNNDKIVLLLDIHPDLGVNSEEVCAYLGELGFSLFADKAPFTHKIQDCEWLYSLIAMRP